MRPPASPRTDMDLVTVPIRKCGTCVHFAECSDMRNWQRVWSTTPACTSYRESTTEDVSNHTTTSHQVTP